MALRLLSFLRRCASLRWLVGSRSARSSELGPPSADAQFLGDATLPASLLRGLRVAKWIDEHGWIALDAFLPDERHPRANGDLEASINWEDTSAVEARTLAEPTAAFGAARLQLSDVVHTLKKEKAGQALTIERSPKPENTHHGDIIYRARTEKVHRKMLASALALDSAFIPPPPR